MGVLAVLIAVNAGLLFLLFRPDRVLTAEPAAQESPSALSPSASSDAASLSPSSSADSTPSVRALEPAPVQRLLLATSSKTAWRATVGDCNTPGKIERSTDGGASWKRIDRIGLAPIVRLGADSSGNIFTIGGTSQSCSVRYVAYARDGTVTASSASQVNVWYPTPKDPDEINGPGGAKATPCKGEVIGLAPLKPSQALVICGDDGAALSSRNSGKTWEQVARIPGTLAITAGSGRYWAAGIHEHCDGLTVQPLTAKSGSMSRGRARCVRGLDVAAGQVAIDVIDGTIWLWSGGRVVVSSNDGQTWN